MAAYDELELAEAVDAGAEFMDAIDANVTDDAERWFWVVDPNTLNIAHCDQCIVGQHAGLGFYDPELYGLRWDDAEAFGFDAPSPGMPTDYQRLRALWREAINDRRAAWFDAHPEYVIAEGVPA